MAHVAERIIEAILAERLYAYNGTDDERAYNQGIACALAAAHEVAAEPDPLRKLAEWLVSLDHGGLLSEYPIVAQIITRAREALGRKEG